MPNRFRLEFRVVGAEHGENLAAPIVTTDWWDLVDKLRQKNIVTFYSRVCGDLSRNFRSEDVVISLLIAEDGRDDVLFTGTTFAEKRVVVREIEGRTFGDLSRSGAEEKKKGQ